MSAACVLAIAEGAVFRPSNHPRTLSDRHVAFDDLLRTNRFEERALRGLAEGSASEAVAVVGPSGVGKSSFVAAVSARLPDSYAAIRLPVSAVADPTDTGEMLKLSLGTILEVIKLDAAEREEVHIERADQRTASRAPTGFTGGRIGGGPIPAAIDVEVGSLRQEFVANKLDGEYLTGVSRVVAILRTKGITPVFVFEDTEAIVGGGDAGARADGFFRGPLHQFVQEIDAPSLIAVQTHLTGSSPFKRLAAGMEIIRLPQFGSAAREAIVRILQRRVDLAGLECPLVDILADDGLDGLVQFYDDTGGDVRRTLAAAQDAADGAAGMGSERVKAGHVRVGAANWR